MLMGPVFRAELLRTARQRRYYALRLVYGLVLFLMVWLSYERVRWEHPKIHLSDVAEFASRTFVSFGIVQLITLLLLVPAVFGGAIADEKQRKTLHYIMASRLSSGEIILDKVLGRSAHLMVFLAIGLPVVSLLGLFGGISVDSVVMAYFGTFSTVAFAITLTVLVSTMARRVRDAILRAYILMLIWLFVPALILLFGTIIRPPLYLWIQPVNDWLADTSPLGFWARSWFWVGLGTRAPSLFDQFLWMVEAQLAGAMLLLLLAIWRLRPTFRSQEENLGRRTWFHRNARRPHPRRSNVPECGDDPILWKERYFAPVDRFTRVTLLPAIVIITLPLALTTEAVGEFSRVLVDFWRFGFSASRSLPESFLWALQVDLGWYAAFWLLAVAGASASSVTIERERDTWVSLTATPLTGWEFVRGKLVGAMWNQRGFAAVLVFVWAVGLITGAVHPLGIALSIAVVALLTWFVATVGVYCSLQASSTSRAMGSTLVAVAFFNAYPLILPLWLIGSISWDSSYPILGAMPWLSGWSMVSPKTVEQVWAVLSTQGVPGTFWWVLVGIGLGVLFVYVGTAMALTRRIIGELDQWLNRKPASPSPRHGAAPNRHPEKATAR